MKRYVCPYCGYIMYDNIDSTRFRCARCKEFVDGWEKDLHEKLKEVITEPCCTDINTGRESEIPTLGKIITMSKECEGCKFKCLCIELEYPLDCKDITKCKHYDAYLEGLEEYD